ncbi:MAG TPA: hypothetical protein VLV25_06755 [Steroidobacteraceae bacterium]|nr:hypothetical protein [Steroidobacteraceae bacterium]
MIGTGLDVWQVVEAYRDVGSVEQMAAGEAASERQVRLALAYYERFPEEVDAAIAANRRPLAQLREEYPFIAVGHGARCGWFSTRISPASRREYDTVRLACRVLEVEDVRVHRWRARLAADGLAHPAARPVA